jgi:ribonuclease T2
VPGGLVDDYLDIIPSAGLIGHQWRKHGSCTGLDQAAYLAATRQAFERVSLPGDADLAATEERIDADELEALFLRANDGMAVDGIAISCADGHIMEARICLTREFGWRSCPEVDARSCRADGQAMPLP